MIMFVVYHDPADYPGQYVVREWRIAPGQPVAKGEPEYVGPDLMGAHEAILRRGPYVGLGRTPSDDPCIKEVWV